jgi:hypothetical protein
MSCAGTDTPTGSFVEAPHGFAVQDPIAGADT